MELGLKVGTNKYRIMGATIVALLLGFLLNYIYNFYEITDTEIRIIIVDVVFCFLVTLIHINLPKKWDILYDLILLFIISMMLAISLDFYNSTFEFPIEDTFGITLTRFLFSSLFIFAFFLLFISIFRRFRGITFFLSFAFTVFGIIGYIIYEFRGSRLLFSDLTSIETAVDVAGGYNYFPISKPLLLGLFISLSIIPVLFSIKKITLRRRSIVRLSFYMIFVFGLYFIFNSPFESFLNSWTEEENSYIYSFATNIKFMEIKPNKDYSEEEVEKIIANSNKNTRILRGDYDPTQAITDQFEEYVTTKGTTNPNIIVIMNESLTDLDVFNEINVSDKVFPFLSSLDNTIKGYTYSDIRGGGTADSEFNFLTSSSTLLLPQNARPYQFYVNDKTPNLVSSLNNQNYETFSIHPGNPLAWNRNVVYDLFGFKYQFFTNTFPDPETFRLDTLVSDRETYNKILEDIDKPNAYAPYFVFNVTIQNHGGYSLDTDNLNLIDFYDEDYNDELNEELTQFLSLMKESDKAFGEFITELQNSDQPTIVLMFGDHQPNFAGDFPSFLGEKRKQTAQEVQSLQKTPYIIWANYDLPDQTIEDISLNYLSTLLLECTGTKLTSYDAYLANLYKDIKVIDRYGIITSDNSYYLLNDSDIPEKYQNLIEQYEDILYYSIVDNENINTALFEVEKSE